MSDEPRTRARPRAGARIRALLAGLGSGPDDEPLPPEVAVRLDETLAGLVAERECEEPPRSQRSDVVPLRPRWTAARRRGGRRSHRARSRRARRSQPRRLRRRRRCESSDAARPAERRRGTPSEAEARRTRRPAPRSGSSPVVAGGVRGRLVRTHRAAACQQRACRRPSTRPGRPRGQRRAPTAPPAAPVRRSPTAPSALVPSTGSRPRWSSTPPEGRARSSRRGPAAATGLAARPAGDSPRQL